MSELWVVITDFNGFQQTRRCLEALRVSSYREFKTVVVDHGTTNETREGLRENFPEVVRLQGSPELWWTGAVNLGTRFALESGATHVVLLNNDCYVAQETIRALVDLSREHPCAILAPIQKDLKSQEVIFSGFRSAFWRGFPTIPMSHDSEALSSKGTAIPVDLIGGGRGVIIPCTVFQHVGLFDEQNFPHYYADHDFYRRALETKIPLLVAPGAIVDVDASTTSIANNPGRLTLKEFFQSLSSRRSHRNVRDISMLFRKHYPVRRLYLVGVVAYVARYCVIYVVRRFAFIAGKI